MNSNKPSILITVQKIIDQGGISTSIQNLLNEIHDIYDVTLCPIEDYICPSARIPANVRILSGSQLIGDAITDRRLLSNQSILRKLRRCYVRLLRRFRGMEYIVKRGLNQIKVNGMYYDVAVAFSGDLYKNGHLIVGGEHMFISQFVSAKRKVAWVHNDIRKQGYNREIATRVFKDFDAIATVSTDNKALVDEMVPEYKDKVYVVYNTYNLRKIINKSQEEINPYDNNGKIHFATVARLSIEQKRQDRIIKVCGRLKKDGFNNFEWYLIGGGEKATLEKMAIEESVTEMVHFVGLKINPYPYMVNADAFVLTSLHEGLPMTVIESKILGCPVLVTNFGSAHETVKVGLEGLICDNSTDGVYHMIKRILTNPKELDGYRLYLKEHPINNDVALRQFKEICGL